MQREIIESRGWSAALARPEAEALLRSDEMICNERCIHREDGERTVGVWRMLARPCGCSEHRREGGPGRTVGRRGDSQRERIELSRGCGTAGRGGERGPLARSQSRRGNVQAPSDASPGGVRTVRTRQSVGSRRALLYLSCSPLLSSSAIFLKNRRRSVGIRRALRYYSTTLALYYSLPPRSS